MNAERRPAWLLPSGPDAVADARRSRREEARALAELVAGFKARHPQLWDELRLCPLQHGIETIVETLAATH